MDTLHDIAGRARSAAAVLATLPTDARNKALLELAHRLEQDMNGVLVANEQDVADGQAAGMDPALVDRLLLSRESLRAMADDVRHVVNLPDPVGEEIDARVLPNGLHISRRRVPLGVLGVIYESRPNVTIDVAALCLKSGNAVILRGGKEARRSNEALAALVGMALQATALPADAVQMVRDPDRRLIGEMVRMRGEIDLIVPRGGRQLIEYVRDNAQVPVLAGGVGVCHTYVHADADLEKALDIVHNAKTRRPSVCNALDTVLVHESVAPVFIRALARRWAGLPVEIRGCDRTVEILEAAEAPGVWRRADPEDYGQEFLALRAAVKVVDDLKGAVDHIERYGSGHSEAIVTEGYGTSREFVNRIDAAAVFVNASTGFTDGAQFGLGAEIGISTQKFHARGPLGLRELTSYKWVVLGDGQIRP
ncbi:MAG TPA: glutamate-5-semialdehyde dehydrogenase [Chloroflexota bacterium]